MIVFKKIKLQNFLSVGKEPVEMTLDSHNLTLVTGENGAAKSAVCIDSIFYALYGKAFRKVVLSNLINSVNKKGLLVELDFATTENEYKIIRGQKPNKFEIYVNGKLKPQMANVKDYQAYLTDYVLKMDEKTFRQLIIIGSSSYTPFMTLTAAERRTVIEDLLRIDIFSSMQTIAKQQSASISSLINDEENKRYVAQMKLEIQKKNADDKLEQVKQSIDEEEQRRKAYTNKKKIVEEQYAVESAKIEDDRLQSVKDAIQKIYDELSTVSQYRAKRIEQGNTVTKHIRFFSENEKCPTCMQVLDKTFVDSKLAELNKKYDKFQRDMSLFNEHIDNLKKKKLDADNALLSMQATIDTVRTIKMEMQNINNFIRSCDERIAQMRKSISDIQKKDTSDMEELQLAIVQMEKLICEEKLKERAINFIIRMLKDDGVKKIIIRSYLPALNKLIKKYLTIMNFDIDFELDENFNEIVKTKSKESYEYNNFSEGEKMRLDCAIMFSFRELAKIQSSVSTNLLILDEFDRGTLDENGFQANVDIIRSCRNENIIVISHSPEYFSSIADRILYAKKEHGFSKLIES